MLHKIVKKRLCPLPDSFGSISDFVTFCKVHAQGFCTVARISKRFLCEDRIQSLKKMQVLFF